MRLLIASCAAAIAASTPTLAGAASNGPFRLDAGVTFSRFEQQVKPEVGGARGERLVEETQVGFFQSLSYRAIGPLSVGAFLQFDAGTRRAARFAGFDSDGRATTTNSVGGSYLELWMGPQLRVDVRSFFAEVGYGLYGARSDSGRDDLPSETGDRSSTLRTSPAVAWSFALGARVAIVDKLDLLLRLQYRVRYYVSRGGDRLDGLVHGTQNLTPFVGVAWSFGR